MILFTVLPVAPAIVIQSSSDIAQSNCTVLIQCIAIEINLFCGSATVLEINTVFDRSMSSTAENHFRVPVSYLRNFPSIL